MLELRIEKLLEFVKAAVDRSDPDGKERSPEVQARFNRIMEKYILSSTHPNIKEFNEEYHSLPEKDKMDLAKQMGNIDRKVFGDRYPQEYFANNSYDILDSLDLEEEPYGFYMHTKDDPKKICGYIYGSNGLNHIDEEEIDGLKEVLTSLDIDNIDGIIADLRSGKVFYVENLATTSECGTGLMPSGALLMVELVKKLRDSSNFVYIFADFLSDSYEIIKAAKSSNIFGQLGAEIILDVNNIFDDGDIYPRSKILIKIK